MDAEKGMGGSYPKVHLCEQRTEAWKILRLGHFTASDFDALMASTRSKTGWSDTQMKIIYRVAAERMTGQSKTTYQSNAMQWGTDQEADAIAAYSIVSGLDVQKVGFVERDEWIGCSPDGLIGNDTIIETKCPESETHLFNRNNPADFNGKYWWQVQGQLWITERLCAELVSYDPRMKDPNKQLFRVPIGRDQEAITALNCRIVSAIQQAKKIMEA